MCKCNNEHKLSEKDQNNDNNNKSQLNDENDHGHDHECYIDLPVGARAAVMLPHSMN